MKTDYTARNIARRHIRELEGEGGFQITNDERQKVRGFGGWRIGVGMSQEVSQRHLEQIVCPVLLVSAIKAAPLNTSGRDSIRDLEVREVAGLHHVHSDRPAAVTGLVLPWMRGKALLPAVGAAAAAKL